MSGHIGADDSECWLNAAQRSKKEEYKANQRCYLLDTVRLRFVTVHPVSAGYTMKMWGND